MGNLSLVMALPTNTHRGESSLRNEVSKFQAAEPKNPERNPPEDRDYGMPKIFGVASFGHHFALGIENAPALLDGVCTPSAARSPYRCGPSTENMRIAPLSMVAL
jgi:hypothetical protein